MRVSTEAGGQHIHGEARMGTCEPRSERYCGAGVLEFMAQFADEGSDGKSLGGRGRRMNSENG